MVFNPNRDEEEQQGGMNILAPTSQQQQQNQQQDAQNQAPNVSGGQSATIDSGQAQQGQQSQSQAPKGQPKKASSGMFTNIRKYIDRNKPGAQKMSGKLQSNISQQNQNIQQAVQKQQSDFMSRVNQNRQRLEGAQQFGQQTLQQAKTQESMPQLQQQQQSMQQRLGQFGDVSDQTQNINQYTGQINTQQGVYDQAQQAYQQAQQQFQQSASQLVPVLGQVQSGLQNEYNRFGELRYQTPTYYSEDQLRSMALAGDQTILNTVDQATLAEQQRIQELQQSVNDPLAAQQLQEAQNRLAAFQQYRQNLTGSQEAQQAQSSALSQLESYQDQLGRAQEQQRLFQNKNQLQSELSELEARIQNAPESLTEDDITRFNNLRTGIERFDDAILNLSQQRRQVGELGQMAESLGTSQGRRNLMRQEFGRQGGYTSGQAALDNLVLTGDPQAMRDLVANSQAQAQQAQDALQQAFQQGRITQDEMARATRNIQRDLQAGVEQAQSALLEGSEDYRIYSQAQDILQGLDSTERRALEKIMMNQDGLRTTTDYIQTTPEQDRRISEALSQLRDIGYDSSMSNRQFTLDEMGLRGRARRGEGTFIKELQDKVTSGQGLSQEDLAILGLTGQERFTQDPTEVLRNIQIDPNQFSVQDVANLTDVARADALARLSGEAAGENRFVTEQLGIDRLDRQAIEARNLKADPAEEFARTREELSPRDNAMVDQFLQNLGNAAYQNVDQARSDIQNSIASYHNGNELAPVASMIQGLVENGSTGWEFGTIDLNKILAGDINEAGKLTHTNYWGNVGMFGRHGIATPPSVMINAVRQAHAKTQALKSAYGATNQNALRSEAQSAYVGQQPVDRIRRG